MSVRVKLGPGRFQLSMAQIYPSKHQIAPTTAIVEGSGSEHFSNKQLAAIMLGVPALITFSLDLSWAWSPLVFIATALPCFIAYHLMQSLSGTPLRPRKGLANRPIDHYLTMTTPDLKNTYSGMTKIPIETFFEAYFDEKIELKGDMLALLEDRYDWANFRFTINQATFFLSQWLPETLWHSRKQDEAQVRNHYDRGDDFYNWFRNTV